MNATARPPLNAVTRKTDPISYSKRLVNEFNLESAPGKGTRVYDYPHPALAGWLSTAVAYFSRAWNRFLGTIVRCRTPS
jgi:hypothetical protein